MMKANLNRAVTRRRFTMNESPLDSRARHHVPDYGEADRALQRRMARELAERNARPVCPLCGVTVEVALKVGETCPNCFGEV